MIDHTTQLPLSTTEYAPWVITHGLRAPYGECQCGCGQPAPISVKTCSRAGHSKGKPIRYISHHQPPAGPRRRPTEERFWNQVDKRSPGECWLWFSGKPSPHYGRFKVGNGQVPAHRYSYELHYGPIPEGMYVCHRCDTPSCVNPHHLFLGTALDNTLDSINKNRWNSPVGEQHHAAKLTEDAVHLIRELASKGVSQPAIALRFSVGQGVISRIVRRKAWKHIE
jgi:hypothetical protein